MVFEGLTYSNVSVSVNIVPDLCFQIFQNHCVVEEALCFKLEQRAAKRVKS